MAIAVVQSISAQSINIADSSITTSALTTTTGHLFIVAVSDGGGGSFSSVTDNKANTYTSLVTFTSPNLNGQIGLYYCNSGTGGAGHTWTFTEVGTGGFPSVHVWDVSGQATTNVTNGGSAVAAATTGNRTSGNLTTTNANDLLVAAINGLWTVDTSILATSPFTINSTSTSTTGTPIGGSSRVVSATGTYSATFTLSPDQSGAANVVIGAFKAAGGANTPSAQAGTLTFTGAIARNISTARSGVLSFVGGIAKNIGTARAGILSFTGAISRNIAKSIASANLTFVGGLTTNKSKSSPQAGTLTFVSAMQKLVSTARAGTLTFAGAITRGISTSRAGILSFTGAIQRSISTARSGTLTFTGGITTNKSKGVSLTASLGLASAIQKLIATARAGTLTFAGALNTSKVGGRGVALSGLQGFIGALSKVVGTTRSGVLSFTGAIKALKSSSSLSGGLGLSVVFNAAKKIFMPPTPPPTFFVGLPGRDYASPGWVQLGVSEAFYTGALSSPTGSIRGFHNIVNFIATLGLSGNINKFYKIALATFSAALSFIGSVLGHAEALVDIRFFMGRAGRTESQLGSLQLGIDRAMYSGGSLTSSGLPKVLKTVFNILATLSFTGNVTKSSVLALNKFSANLSFVGLVTKNQILLKSTFNAALSFTGGILYGLFKKSYNALLILQNRGTGQVAGTLYGPGTYGRIQYGGMGGWNLKLQSRGDGIGIGPVYGIALYGAVTYGATLVSPALALFKRVLTLGIKSIRQGSTGTND